jgi:dihydroorotase
MIDPHVHLRDFNETKKETLAHGLSVARRAGLDGVFEMPNTDPPLIERSEILRRIALADSAHAKIFHGIFGGITTDVGQIRDIVALWKELFPRIVGLKLYAGVSTGNLAVTEPETQKLVLKTLTESGFIGVLAVHCEKTSLFKPELARDNDPFTHTIVRPPESEIESISDIIGFAEQAGLKGTLHICHISVPESLEEVERARTRKRLIITCGITPHHALMYDTFMNEKDGFLLRMNPPLRIRASQKKMLEHLLAGNIDWIETDHAPHTLTDKKAASGIPVLPFYPHFIKKLVSLGMDQSIIDRCTHRNIVNTFGINITAQNRKPDYNLKDEYEYDPFALIK